MQLFLAYVSVKFKTSLMYKHTIYISILTSVVLFVMQKSFWNYVGEYSSLNFNFTHYFVSLLLISPFINSNVDRDMQSKYLNGSISTVMTKPISLLKQYLFGELADIAVALVLKIIPLMIVVMCFISLRFMLDVNAGVLSLSLMLSFLMTWSLSCMTGMTVVLFSRNEGFIQFRKIIFSLFSGSLIPLDVMPDNIKPVFMINPFRSIVDIPIRIMMNNYSQPVWSMLGFQFCWTMTFVVLLLFVYKLTIRKINISGG